jgi:hypothetical protein
VQFLSHPPRSKARGQALLELVICAVLLVPLFLLLPVVAKYTHANLMAQQAARNVAWEAAVSPNHALPTGTDLQKIVLDRNFAAADAPILTKFSTKTRGEFDDPMLNTFSGRKLLERDNLHVRSLSAAKSPGYLDKALSLLDALPKRPPLNKQGYVTAELELQYRNLQTSDGHAAAFLDPFDKLNLVLQRRHSVLTDTWSASGPRGGGRSVVSVVEALVPTSLIPGSFNSVLKNLSVLEPILPIVGALGGLKLGTIEPDIVPFDKLDTYPVK